MTELERLTKEKEDLLDRIQLEKDWLDTKYKPLLDSLDAQIEELNN